MTDLRPDAEGCVRLAGQLTVDEVPSVYRGSLAWRNGTMPAIIDLSGLEGTDSSAVALLLEWAEWACRAGIAIEFRNPPEALCTIAGLSNLKPLLGWEES
ncbi:MAG: STAS domain-containing protein [Wenzhouxiangellaceae bacterium]|nr:STAS domain-containing protein [Wenzhouxiangellaceae bacterium]